MKKFMMMLLAVCLMAPAANAQNKQLQKKLKKEYKQKKKELAKGGWEIFGSARTLDVELLKYYDKLEQEGDKVLGIMGTAEAKSKNLASIAAQNNAANRYAATASSKIVGQMISDMNLDSADEKAEFDRFAALYKTQVEQEIKGEMRPGFSIARTTADGKTEVQSFFIVNDDGASRARIKAYEDAKKESDAAQKYAVQLEKFVLERVEIDE